MSDRPLAEKAATWERQVGSDPRDPEPTETSHQRDVVSEDTLIARPDLGPDTYTLVAAGDEVPADLADNERRPYTQADAETTVTSRPRSTTTARPRED